MPHQPNVDDAAVIGVIVFIVGTETAIEHGPILLADIHAFCGWAVRISDGGAMTS